MTNLTEQYRKGELNNGFYYVEINEPFKPLRVEIVENYNGLETDIDNNYIVEILAEVPTYYEWQKTETQRIKLMTKLNDVNNENHALEIKNTKLKELLKEWLLFEKEENPHDFTIMSERMEELAKQSKELLGDK